MFRIIAVVVSALIFSSLAVAKPASPEPSIGQAFSDAIIKRYSPTIDEMGHDGWDHSNSIVLHGIEKTYNKTHNKKYLKYIKAYADSFINKDGSIKSLTPTLDGMHPGVLCLFLYEQTGDEKYKLAAKRCAIICLVLLLNHLFLIKRLMVLSGIKITTSIKTLSL